jgi:hypothetical protein
MNDTYAKVNVYWPYRRLSVASCLVCVICSAALGAKRNNMPKMAR